MRRVLWGMSGTISVFLSPEEVVSCTLLVYSVPLDSLSLKRLNEAEDNRSNGPCEPVSIIADRI